MMTGLLAALLLFPSTAVPARHARAGIASHVQHELDFKSLLPTIPLTTLAADESAIQALDHKDSHEPAQNGIVRALPSITITDVTPSGPRIGIRRNAGETLIALSVTVVGAARVRLHLKDVVLDSATDCWVVGGDDIPVVFGTELLGPGGDVWSPSTPGDTVSLYVRTRAAAKFVLDGALQIMPKIAASACAVDATCVDTGTFDDINEFRGAVARIDYVANGASYTCSGALLNDRSSSLTPYFLTAGVCANTSAAAASVETFWDYSTPFCGASPDGATASRADGATLLATSATAGFTFLRLGPVPGSRDYLGWTTFSQPNGTTVHRLSFPNGGPESYSQGTIAVPNCSSAQAFWYSQRAQGVVSQNSMVGAPLVLGGDKGPYVIGNNWGFCLGSSDECAPTAQAVDAAFASTYALIAPWIDIPSASFSYAPANPAPGQAVQFTDTSGAAATAWQWSFDDGNASNLQNPEHSFQQSRTYHVTLTVANNNGQTSTTTQNVTINASCGAANCLFLSGSVHMRVDAGTYITGNGSAARQVRLLDNQKHPTSYAVPISASGTYALIVPSGTYTAVADIEYVDAVYQPQTGVTTPTLRRAMQQRTVPVATGNVTLDFAFPPPIVLLHGILSGPGRWTAWSTHFGVDTNQPDTHPSENPDVMIFTPGYNDSDPYDLEASSVQADLWLSDFKFFTSVPRFRVIAHSKGGLVARELYGQLYMNAMDALVFLGTPNSGSNCFTGSVATVWRLSRCDVQSFNDSAPPVPPRMLAIAGTEPLVIETLAAYVLPIPIGAEGCAAEIGPSDGAVPVDSVLKISTSNGPSVTLTGMVVPYNHLQLGSDEQTAWLINAVIMPFFDGLAVPPSAPSLCCADNFRTKDVRCTEPRPAVQGLCVSGRGFNGATCNVTTRDTSVLGVLISWILSSNTLTMYTGIGRDPGCSTTGASVVRSLDNAPVGYHIYRDAVPITDLARAHRIAFVAGNKTSFVDPAPLPGLNYYAVTAVYASSESAPATAAPVQFAEGRHRAVHH